MKERPIIMGAESVKAVLEGRKTQTRRVVKKCCPYGKVGDRLWVRETWKPGAWRNDGRVAIDYMASPELTHTPWIHMEDQASKFIPRWLNEISKIGLTPNHEGRYEWEHGKSPFKWKRAMYMPRFASRITLEIADIRIERLQDITEEDARSEGMTSPFRYVGALRNEYQHIWNSLNAKRGYPWENNPWVWVVSFKVVQ